MINNWLYKVDNLSEKAREYLNIFKNKFSSEEIISIIDSLKDLKVLVIGDCILDEYVFCDVMGKDEKEPLLVYNQLNSEKYAGGVLAIANHLADFVDKVNLITSSGKKDEVNELLESKLNRKINKKIFFDEISPSLTKKRYIERYTNRKVFEIYNEMYHNIDERLEGQITDYLYNNIKNFDITIVSDFGHGMITDNIKNLLLETKNGFMAVNVQTNSGNYGYNYVTKYNNVDFVSLNDVELRLSLQDRKSDFETLVEKLSKQVNCNQINLTLGKSGSLYYQGKSHRVPAFASQIIDTEGAGDAILSITSLLAYKKVNPEIIPFIGNCVGALAVQIMGNKEPINPINLNTFIADILK